MPNSGELALTPALSQQTGEGAGKADSRRSRQTPGIHRVKLSDEFGDVVDHLFYGQADLFEGIAVADGDCVG